MRSTLTLLALSSALSAQAPAIIITDFPVTYVYQSYPQSRSDAGGRSGFSAGGANHVAANWWYYCIAGDTAGSAFYDDQSTMTATTSADRKTGTLTWTNVDGRGFDAKLVNCVHKVTSTSGVSAQTMTLTNTMPNPITLTLYTYADFDLEGFGGDDSCVQVPGAAVGQQRISDATALCYYKGQNYNAWEVDAWPLLRDRIIQGVNGQCYQLANTGLPFGPGDYSGAFSWSVTIPAFGSQSFRALCSVVYNPPSNNTAEVVRFGTAKAGTNGVPAWADNRPFAGTTAVLEVRNGVAGASPLLLIGTTTTTFPFPPFGTVFVLPVANVTMPAFNAGNISKMNLAIPPVGAGFAHFQAFWPDAGAAGGMAHTEGMTWNIGSY